MTYSAKVPENVIKQLPDNVLPEDSRRIFRAVYKEVCGEAGVDMQDIHPDDDTYRNMALYATYKQLYTSTGEQEYLDCALELEDSAKEIAALEGVDIERLAASQVYYVACNVRPAAVAIGKMPDSQPLSVPYCSTHMQAEQLLSLLRSEPEMQPASRFGPNGDKMPDVPAVHCIYTVLAGPERVQALAKTPEHDLMLMPPMAAINPKTVTEVNCIVWADDLHAGKDIVEDVAYGDKPHHEAVRRELDMRMCRMYEYQTALGRTPAALRGEVDLSYFEDGHALHMCFSQDAFVHQSPFKLTFQERLIQLAMREMISLCNAYTLKHSESLVDGFKKEFSGEIPSMRDCVAGLQRHLQAFQETASPGDRESIAATIASAQTIVNVVSHEKAENLLVMQEPLTAEQRQYLTAAKTLVPETLRNEFILRAADQIERGLSMEAAVRIASRAMAKEAGERGQPLIEDKLNAVGENAGIQYEMYKNALETEEVEV